MGEVVSPRLKPENRSKPPETGPVVTEPEPETDPDRFVPERASNIRAVSWMKERMVVRFVSGGTYSYDDVPRETFEALRSARSVGSAFHRLVRTPGSASRKEPVE